MKFSAKRWTKGKLLHFTIIVISIIALYSLVIFKSADQAETLDSEIKGVVIRSIVNSDMYTSHILMHLTIKLETGIIINKAIPIDIEIKKGTKIIVRKYLSSISKSVTYRPHKYFNGYRYIEILSPLNPAFK